MPTPTKGPRLGGSPQHERLLLANLATALFAHDAITTTEAKAKRLRPFAEHLVTQAKKGDLHNFRQLLKVVKDVDVAYRLRDEIAPRYAERPGGYTRITKLGPRKGDNAPMARIELVEALTVAQEAVGEAERARGNRRRGGAADADVPSAAASETAEAAATTEAADSPEPIEATDFAAEATTGGPVDAEDTAATRTAAEAEAAASAEEPESAQAAEPAEPAEPAAAESTAAADEDGAPSA